MLFRRNSWKILFFIFLVFYGCAAFGAKDHKDLNKNAAKIDPVIARDLEGLKAGRIPPDQEIDVLIRTEKALTPDEKATLEKNGASVRSSIGNISSASARLSSIENISNLPFVVYIEKSRKERLRKP